jgi:hypothetical protein
MGGSGGPRTSPSSPRLKRLLLGGALVAVALLGAVAISVAMAPRPLVTPPPVIAVDIWAVTAWDSQHIVGVGGTDDNRGTLAIAESIDGGATWSVRNAVAPALTTIDSMAGGLVGGTDCAQGETSPAGPPPGSCLYASDVDDTWRDLSAGRIVGPSFIDALTGWAHTPVDINQVSPASLFATQDGGSSWDEVARPCDSDTPFIVTAVLTESHEGYVVCRGKSGVGGSASAYHWKLIVMHADRPAAVRQAGTTGDPLSPFNGSDVNGLTMLADGHGFLLTETVYATVDGGVTWTPSPTGESLGYFQSGAIVTDDVAFVSMRSIGNYTRIYGTADGGTTWMQLGSWPYSWSRL